MKKILTLALASLTLVAPAAMAQQYVYPMPTQNSYAPPSSRPMFQDVNPQTVLPMEAPVSPPAPRFSNAGTGLPPVPAPQTDDMVTPRAFFMGGHDWTGCYAGAYVGGAAGQRADANELLSRGGASPVGTAYNVTTTSYGYDMGSSFAGGGTIGCNYEIQQQWGAMTGYVMGFEGEIGSLSLSGSGLDPNSSGVALDTHDKTTIGGWDGILAGRLGVAFDRTLLYGKLGAVFTQANSSISDTCTTAPCGAGTINASGHENLANVAIGAGAEYAITNAWSIKGEYMYLDTSSTYEVCGPGGASAAGSTFCSQHDLNGTHLFKVGLNYHFNDLFGGRSTGPRW